MISVNSQLLDFEKSKRSGAGTDLYCQILALMKLILQDLFIKEEGF